MEIYLRILNFLNVILGKIILPIYPYFANLPRKPLPAQNQAEILNQSATSLAKKIRTKQLTSSQVVNAFIERCKQVNSQINAIIEDRYEIALEEAKNVDRIIQSNTRTVDELEKDSPLLGVPISVKEVCMVKGSSYTGGAKLRKGIKATEDGEAIANLRKAGAIPIVVTNVPELCCSYETRSDIIGYTSNPYDPNRTSGGSSGGEAALISSAGSVLGVGSDFGGSIRVPSFFCGIFGHRPTSGIISLKGHLPDSPDEHYQKVQSIGPMCRYAEDLKLAFRIMGGEKTASLKLDQKVDLQKLKIRYKLDNGFTLSEIPVDSEIKSSILKAVKHFQDTYQCSAQTIDLPEMRHSLEMCITQGGQMKNLKEALLLKDPKDESSLTMELLKFLINKASYSIEILLMRFNMEAYFRLVRGSRRATYIEARTNLSNRLKEILQDDGVLFFPTFASLAFYKQQSFWKISSTAYPMMVNILGFPATHVTMGLNKDGIPVGFQVIAAPNQDRLCFAVAEELEKAFGGWVPPPTNS